MRRAVLLFVAAVCVACHGGLEAEPPDDLTGATFPLGSGSAMRLVTRGSVGPAKADIAFDSASTYARVSPTCFARGDAPSSAGFVSLQMAAGLLATYPEVMLHGVRIGSLRMGSFKAALDVSLSRCEVILGTDFLVRYALEADPANRQLKLSAPRPPQAYREALPAGPEDPTESYLLTLSKDPATDWPLVTGRLVQGRSALVGPFLLATTSPHSVVSAAAAKQVGLLPGPDLLAEYGLSAQAEVADNRPAAFPLDVLELTPQLGIRWVNVEAATTWSNPGAVGTLGSDVWGRFKMTLDVNAGVLRLSRPRVLTSGDRSRCATRSGFSEDGCFDLRVVPTPRGAWVTGAVWRALPEGGRLYLDALGPDGKPVNVRCRAGLSFDRSERGVSTSHVFPWTGVASSLPACAEELRKATSFGLALFEEGDLADCPGECAFVEDLEAGIKGFQHNRVSCECQPQIWGTGSDSERKFLRLYREALDRLRARQPAGLPAPSEPEPAPP